jgi:dCTP deaminase
MEAFIEKPKSLLSDKAILRHMKEGFVIIEPFVPENLSTSSYDVTLGENYYREQFPKGGGYKVYNPYSERDVKKIWGEPKKAKTMGNWRKKNGFNALENIEDSDQVIWIKPGETILCHTNEYLGGNTTVSTMMKARSSMVRNFIEVCKCAGWGDIGYVNRWTMEVTNNSRYYSIPMIVGRRIAQIVFFDTEGTDRSYANEGKYQTSDSLSLVKERWSPSDMLPKLYKDREIKIKPETDKLKEFEDDRSNEDYDSDYNEESHDSRFVLCDEEDDMDEKENFTNKYKGQILDVLLEGFSNIKM